MKRKLVFFVALASSLLIIPLVFSLGLVDVSKFSLGSSPASSMIEPASSSTPTVFVDPVNTIDAALQSGSYFTVHVNISDVTDLFAWQINMSWNPSILDVNEIVEGEFLLRTTSVDDTTSYQLGFVINVTDNTEGYTGMAESILGSVSGINGSGRLVSIEFLVTGYGSTDLTISLDGALATTLLNNTIGAITFTKADGYFSNKLLGDCDGDADKDVDYDDFIILAGAYGSSSGQPAYDERADFDRNGAVGYDDFIVLAGNYGTSI